MWKVIILVDNHIFIIHLFSHTSEIIMQTFLDDWEKQEQWTVIWSPLMNVFSLTSLYIKRLSHFRVFKTFSIP